MKIAITDACIFIDLYELELVAFFFNLDIEVHTSIDVMNELYAVQQQFLSAFQSVGKLTTHNITEDEKQELARLQYPKSLSESDKTVLFLATKLKAIVISSDKTVRKCAKNNCIEYHGMIWVFDKLVEKNLISKTVASLKLKQLIMTNLVYQNNKDLVMEMEKRLKLWAK
jgi:predicted nucleic acid-binding protein